MTRGRKKDLTIPSTRSLVQQREYRARRAQYVTDLEDRCQRAEEENIQLRKDLTEARTRLASSSIHLPQNSIIASELLHNLSAASASIAKFQHAVFQDPTSSSDTQGETRSVNPLPFTQPRDVIRLPPITELEIGDGTQHLGLHRAPVQLSRSTDEQPLSNDNRSTSPGPTSVCCEGYFDCGEFPDEDGDLSLGQETMSRISEARTTYCKPRK